MLLANKLAVVYLPIPSVVSFIQIIFATIAILVMKKLEFFPIDDLEWSKVKAYSLYIVAFVGSIYANMQALSHSNVDTVIVFRACSPIECSAMGRELPSVR